MPITPEQQRLADEWTARNKKQWRIVGWIFGGIILFLIIYANSQGGCRSNSSYEPYDPNKGKFERDWNERNARDLQQLRDAGEFVQKRLNK